MNSVVASLKIAQIRTDGGTQPRAALNEAIVAEYAESLTDGAKMPPVIVYHDGVDYWLADGFHRFHAHRKIDARDIETEVRQGTKRDAILHSVGANAAHGLRRTNEDKRKAVMTLLDDPEWAKWSDREVARQCGVSHPFVAALRSPVAAERQQANRAASNARKVESDSTFDGQPASVPTVKSPPRAIESAPLPEEQMGSDDELAEAHHTITDLATENEALRDRLAVEAMDASEDEKLLASETIAELRDRVKSLEAENDALKASRDTYMQKVSEMQRQINHWRKKAEKVAA